QRQILLADFVVGADNAALKDAPEARNRIRVHRAHDIFALRMLDDFVGIQFLDVVVADPFVGHEQADFAINCVHDEFGEQFAAHSIDHAGHDVALAAHSADNWRLAGANATTTGATTAIAPVLVLGLSANERFVHLNDTAQLVKILFDKRRADAV